MEAVIFDRDGVLTYFDLEAADLALGRIAALPVLTVAREWDVFGNARGFPVSLQDEAAFFHQFWHHLGAQYDLSPEQIEQLIRFDYVEFIRAFDDVPETLASLRAQGFKIGVLSNFSLASLDRSLGAVGLSQFVHAACAAPVIGHYKPAAAAYQAIAAQLNVRPQRCLFFDDEQACVDGAGRAGMHAFLVDRRRDPRHYDLQTRVIGSLRAVREVV